METNKQLNVPLVNPMGPPQEVTIDHSLKALQDMVGGTIECVYPFEEPVGIICNDEGKLLGLPPNRPLRTESGEIYDIICGNFLVVGLNDEGFCSLPPQQISHFKDLYSREMIFSRPPQSRQRQIIQRQEGGDTYEPGGHESPRAGTASGDPPQADG